MDLSWQSNVSSFNMLSRLAITSLPRSKSPLISWLQSPPAGIRVVSSAAVNIKGHLFTASKLLQSCPTLCDPINGSPPGSAVPGILQARTLERVAISFSNAW